MRKYIYMGVTAAVIVGFAGYYVLAQGIGQGLKAGSKGDAGKTPAVRASATSAAASGAEPETQPAGGAKPKKALFQTVKVYFSDEQAMYLEPEKQVVSMADPISGVVKLLLEGPKDPRHGTTIPVGTKLISAWRKGAVAYVNFSKEFVTNHPGGSAGEQITIYSIVNSLTNLKGISRVKFLVDGKGLLTLKGHIDLSAPVGRDADLIRK